MKGKIFELPSDIRRRELEEAEAKGRADMTEDILTVGPLIKENKDDTDIAQITGWSHEKIAEYRKLLNAIQSILL